MKNRDKADTEKRDNRSIFDFNAVIFDLDGVVTDTASVHARAWKEMFDSYLKKREERENSSSPPFDIKKDYHKYVDGMPRYDGVETFLAARGIELEYGSPDDPAGTETVCGLGNRKNELFQKILKEEGDVKVYHSTVDLIVNLREKGIRTAIVSSSKNCRTILEKTGLTDLFDARVDGIDGAEQNLKGKPAPDTFLAAARQLGVRPEQAVVVEDAISGVEAGRSGDFGWVVGVDRNGINDALYQNGADRVVSDLKELDESPGQSDKRASDERESDREESKESARSSKRDAGDVPLALDHFEEIRDRLKGKIPTIFLDFDGTLAPIVDQPDQANLSEEMRKILKKLGRICTVAVVSGRGLSDVEDRVGLKDLYYAGSHGFEIHGPNGENFQHDEGVKALPDLDAAQSFLEEKLADIEGVLVERKKFSIAIHYRNVAEADTDGVARAVDAAAAEREGLRKSGGKKIFELQPDIDWHKGRALEHLMKTFGAGAHPDGKLPLYIGDDLTDEDAFAAIEETGIGIVVHDPSQEGRRSTKAQYRLADVDGVIDFLERFLEVVTEEQSETNWTLTYEGFDPENQGLREALCTLGNGYFCTRGAAEESKADDIHYPGTYLAGGYNRLKTEVRGKIVENEDLVNMPNWLPLTFRIEDGEWFDLQKVKILYYRQDLDLKRGVLHRKIRFRDDEGRITRVQSRRLVHMSCSHLAAQELTVSPENWEGSIEFRTALDGRVTNAGVARYSDLNGHHLRPVEEEVFGDEIIGIRVETSQSHLQVAQSARTRIYRNHQPVTVERKTLTESGYAAQYFRVNVDRKIPATAEKVVSMYTSRDPAVSDVCLETRKEVLDAGTFDELLRTQTLIWEQLWSYFDITFEDRNQKRGDRISRILHLHIFHLLQTASVNSMVMDLDVGVPSRGWHGEAYRGHILWDELFIFPTYNWRLPEITKELLMYRYRRLAEARTAAREAGFKGAMYPWQSGSNGKEESQKIHLNPRSGRWIPDNSNRQRHVNAAIAYNIYHYYQVTRDIEFLAFYGGEMILEIARFWSSIATFNAKSGRYEISGVMGPDEYHEAYPNAERPGLDNNAYTNVMAVWVLERAMKVLDILPEDMGVYLRAKLDIDDEELSRWEDITRKMKIPFHDNGIISQFEGYEQLEEFDWEGYKEKYGDIQRLDRILESENDSPNRYKLSKQADVLMLFYLLPAEEISEIFERLGYPFEYETIPKNIDYYLKRTAHGSTLSWMVHSWVLSRSDRARSWELFNDALCSDVADIQGGTTPEGIHLGAMAGTVDQMQRGYTGIMGREDVVWFDPCLPEELDRLSLQVRYRGCFLKVEVTTERLTVTALRARAYPIKVGCNGEVIELGEQESRVFDISG